MRKPVTIDKLELRLKGLISKYPWIKILYETNCEELSEIVDYIHSEGYQLGYDEGYSDGVYDQKTEDNK